MQQSSFFPKSYISIINVNQVLQILIETPRLLIQSYKECDFENCVSLYGNEKITKFFDHGRPRNRKEVEKLVREKGTRYFIKGEPFGLFSIFRKEDMTFMGQIDLLPTNDLGTAEIGFILNADYHNQGFCSEAVKAMLIDYTEELNYRNFDCNKLPLTKIIATAHPDNLSSNKVLAKVGMSFDKRQNRFGKPRLWYSILLEDSYKKQKIRLR